MAARGSTKLAAVLQSRMGNIKNFNVSPVAEFGKIDSMGNLVLDSFPDEVVEKTEYVICDFAQKLTLDPKDRVLILWADDIPVILGKIKKKG